MNNIEHLIEQHIREYESRLRHIDELYDRAHSAATDKTEEVHSDLKNLAAQRDLLHDTTRQMRDMPLDRWQRESLRNAGPMVVWDVFARKLEDFVERHE